jgi:hypothetical protein
MMKIAAGVLLILLSSEAIAEDCLGSVSRIRKIKDVGEFYPLFVRDDRGIPYTVSGNCVKLYGGAFRGTLTFVVRNRFQNFKSQPVGIIKAKSLRTFASDSGPRIKVSRTTGWYAPALLANGTRATMPSIPDRELRMKPDQWNDFHSRLDNGSELNKNLRVDWHGVADNEGALASVDTTGFWSFDTSESRKRVLTNYLIRFDTANEGEPIEFYTEVPSGVSRIDLSIDSNLERIRGNYAFIIED